jgi:hypothetical protein
MKKIILFLLLPMLVKAQCPPNKSFNIVFTGNSIFANYPAYDVWGGESPVKKTVKLLKDAGYVVTDTNIAVSGANMNTMLGQVPSIDKFVKANKLNILVCNEFHNSAAANMKGEIIAGMVFQFVSEVKKKGYDRVVWLSAHPADFISPDYPYYRYDSMNPKRLIFNRLLKDSASKYSYDIVDIAAHKDFKDSASCSNTAIYLDRLHLNGNGLGSKIYADIIFQKLDRSLCDVLKLSSPIAENTEGGGLALKVFPNPTGDIVNFSEISAYELYDIVGRLIEKNKADKVALPQRGLYFLKFQNQIRKVVRYQ